VSIKGVGNGCRLDLFAPVHYSRRLETYRGVVKMNFAIRVTFFLALCAALLGPCQGTCWQGHAFSCPKEQHATSSCNQTQGLNIGAWLVSIFRDHISRVDGERCPSSPTCSSYSVMAFQKHGFIMGWLMTVDRLIHEPNEGKVSPIVYVNGRAKILDPVENNDFWWSHQDEQGQD